VDDQDDVDVLESATDGYAMLDASCGWRIVARDRVHDVIVAGTNLADELAENHVSFLKDVTPLPGRSLTLTYRVIF
jgi:iron complex outermembrane receptor protein